MLCGYGYGYGYGVCPDFSPGGEGRGLTLVKLSLVSRQLAAVTQSHQQITDFSAPRHCKKMLLTIFNWEQVKKYFISQPTTSAQNTPSTFLAVSLASCCAIADICGILNVRRDRHSGTFVLPVLADFCFFFVSNFFCFFLFFFRYPVTFLADI